MLGLQALHVGCLAQGVGAQRAEGLGEGFALCGIALDDLLVCGVEMGGKGKGITYVSAQDQVVYHAYHASHHSLHSSFAFVGAREVDCLAIAQEAAGEELVVDVQRRGLEAI